MSRWFRLYDDVLNDPKILRLSYGHFTLWIRLLCVASKHDGTLPEIDTLTHLVRWRRDQLSKAMDDLISDGLLDRTDNGLEPHNWNGRQFKSDVSTERVKRFRNGRRNVTETPPDTDTDTDTDTDLSSLRSERTRARASDSSGNEFATFWQKYPHKVGKRAAEKAFSAAKAREPNIAVIMGGLETYVCKTDDRPWCNPATWLNQDRWNDQPAPEIRGNNSLMAANARMIDQFGGVNAARKYVPGSAGPGAVGLDNSTGAAVVRFLPKG